MKIKIEMIISLRTCKEQKVEKTKWMIENIVKDKMKLTVECSQDEMVFLDTKIVADITTYMYSKKMDTHQYLSPTSCHPKN